MASICNVLRAPVSRIWNNVRYLETSSSIYTNRLSSVSRASNQFIVMHRHYATDDVSSEERLAAKAAKRDEPNIFQKIIDGQVKADVVYEDSECISFRDVNPVAPTHIIIIPRKPIPCLSEASDEDSSLLGHLLTVARKVAAQEGLAEGFRIVLNNGRHGSQSIYHLHIHVVGGRQMRWPPG